MTDVPVTFKGVTMNARLSCFSVSDERESQKYIIHVTLTFPDSDWKNILDVEWRYREDRWDYKTCVAIKLTSDPVSVKRKTPPNKWEFSVVGYKYKPMNGMVVNETKPDRFEPVSESDREGIMDAVNLLFKDDPNLFHRLIAEELGEKVKYQQEDVDRARSMLKMEERRLAETKAFAAKHRPKDIPEETT